MPAALAPAALRVAHIDDDCPMTGRPFADVALHWLALLWTSYCVFENFLFHNKLDQFGCNAGF